MARLLVGLLALTWLRLSRLLFLLARVLLSGLLRIGVLFADGRLLDYEADCFAFTIARAHTDSRSRWMIGL